MNSNRNEPELTGQERVRNPDVSYESRDLSARAVIGFLIVLAVAGAVVQIGLWGFYKYLVADELQSHPITNPIGTSKKQLEAVGGDPAVKFPSPQLQPDPVADLNKFRVREEELLNTYGWVDQRAGKVHIPIERAMDLLVQAGLPTRPGAQGLPQQPPGATQSAGGIKPESESRQPQPGQQR